MISYVIQQERGVRSSERPAFGSGAPHHHLNLPSGQTEKYNEALCRIVSVQLSK